MEGVGYREGFVPLLGKKLFFSHNRWCILMQIKTNMQQDIVRLQNCARSSNSDYFSTPRFRGGKHTRERGQSSGLETEVPQWGPGAEPQ